MARTHGFLAAFWLFAIVLSATLVFTACSKPTSQPGTPGGGTPGDDGAKASPAPKPGEPEDGKDVVPFKPLAATDCQPACAKLCPDMARCKLFDQTLDSCTKKCLEGCAQGKMPEDLAGCGGGNKKCADFQACFEKATMKSIDGDGVDEPPAEVQKAEGTPDSAVPSAAQPPQPGAAPSDQPMQETAPPPGPDPAAEQPPQPGAEPTGQPPQPGAGEPGE